MFLAIFHFDELLLTCWSAINHLDCMSKSTFPSRFYFFFLIFYLSSFLPDLHFSFLIFIFFLLLSDPFFFLFVIMVSFYSWSSSSSDHLPTVFCLCLLFIFFLILNISHLLQSRSIFHETKSFSCFFLFSKEKGRRCQFDPYLYSHYLDCRFFHSDIWYFDNFKLIICLHCNHSLMLHCNNYRLIIFLYLEKWLLYCFLTIITVSFLLKLCIVVAITISRG